MTNPTSEDIDRPDPKRRGGRRPSPLTPRWLLGIWLVCSWLGMTGPLAAQQEPVDFQRDIWPLFQQHCLSCHGPQQAKGDLRLDTVQGARRGGHSGNPLLAGPRQESEIYLRIASDSEAYRMPRDNPPLAPEEVERIGRWLDAGAAWPEEAVTAGGGADPSATWTQWAADKWLWAAEKLEQPSWQGLLVTVAIGLLGLPVWWKLRQRRSRSADRHVHRLPGWVLAGGLVLLGGGLFLAGRLTELTRENEELRQELAALEPAPPEDPRIDLSHLPLPPYPMHPPRLGGTYYRGNDERSPQLFNGGFYRTATMELHLVDSQGQRLAWQDPLPEQLAVELIIERAPQATPELYTDRVRQTVSLKHYRDPARPGDAEPDALELEEVEPGQTWRARIPLDAPSTWDRNRQCGMIYLFYGSQQRGQHRGRAHFVIRYQLEQDADRGQIADSSVLWMGSLYNLAGRVLVPDDKHVLLDRWFDFRPIPVIEGQPSQDPQLLGLPEHISEK